VMGFFRLFLVGHLRCARNALGTLTVGA